MVQVRTKRFTVDDYERMIEAGILDENDRVELIRGEIVEMAAVGGPHASCVDRLTFQFSRHPAIGLVIVRVQSPIKLAPHSEPEPDISLLRPREDYYASGHPGPDDILLIVEVSDSSLPYDRGTKVPLYAEAGIVEVWLVDIEHQRIELFSQPEAGQYRQHDVLQRDAVLTPQALPDVTIPVRAILG